MSVDKLVDSAQLDSDLTSVANAIRAKSGGSGQLAFPSGFVSEIGNIPSGGGGGTGYALLASGSYTYAGSETATLSIPISYSGTPIFGYVVADELLASTNQSCSFLVIPASSSLPFMQSFPASGIGLVAYSTGTTVGGYASNTNNNFTTSAFNLSRANNTYKIQPNTYHWYIYGEA